MNILHASYGEKFVGISTDAIRWWNEWKDGKHLHPSPGGCSVQPDAGDGVVPAIRKWRHFHTRKQETHCAGWTRANLPRTLAVGAERQQDRVAPRRIPDY